MALNQFATSCYGIANDGERVACSWGYPSSEGQHTAQAGEPDADKPDRAGLGHRGWRRLERKNAQYPVGRILQLPGVIVLLAVGYQLIGDRIA